VLPIRNESTGEAKLLYFQDGTKFMVVQGIVAIRTDVSKNTDGSADAWWRVIVREISARFGKKDLKLSFGGDPL